MLVSGPGRQDGRLAPFAMGYRVRLLEQGYTPGTVRGMLKVFGQFGRWLDVERVQAGRWTWRRSMRSWRRGVLSVIVAAWVSCVSWWRICGTSG
jgi:hypothetical protein